MSALEQYPRITPLLWFNGNAEDAVNHYLAIFANARRIDVVRVEGRVLTIAFELDGQMFTAINGGPMYQFTPGISFVVRCDSQQEIDHYWAALTAGGTEVQCGWLTDKFGLSWQVVPGNLPDLIRQPAAMQAMMQMKKLDLALLKNAAGL